MSRTESAFYGNDTIDRYPPACERVEKILCVSERIFKKIQKDFERFGIKVRPKPKSLNEKANKAQIKAPKTMKPASKPQPLPYGLMNKPNSFEPSNGIGNLDNTYRHRVGRLNDWYETYGQGMYE